MTHINDPKSFFVRAAYIEELLECIERPGPGVSANEIHLGQKVVYESQTQKKFVRGDIRFMDSEGRCDIYAMDYGCFDKSVSVKDIHHLDSRAEPQNRCPGLATHCQLHLCEPKGETFSDEVIRTMKDLVGSHTASINVTSKRSDQLVVELITVDCPRDVASMLGLVGLTTLTKGQFTVNRLTRSTAALKLTTALKYKHKQLKVGDVINARVQSGTSVTGFYVADVNDFKMLRREEPSFSLYCKNRRLKDEDFVPGKPCAVKLDNLDQYERAIIKEVRPYSTALLELVDWGKEVESRFTSIRSIDSEFYLDRPIIAIYCSTTEDQVWSSSLPSFFFKGFELGIKIMELGNYSDKPHKVNIYPKCMLKY